MCSTELAVGTDPTVSTLAMSGFTIKLRQHLCGSRIALFLSMPHT